jgi:hypothetical protein
MDATKVEDSNEYPAIGSKWTLNGYKSIFQVMGFGLNSLVNVKAISPDAQEYWNAQEYWKHGFCEQLSIFKKEYKPLEEKSLSKPDILANGLDKNGKPLIGSVWLLYRAEFEVLENIEKKYVKTKVIKIDGPVSYYTLDQIYTDPLEAFNGTHLNNGFQFLRLAEDKNTVEKTQPKPEVLKDNNLVPVLIKIARANYRDNEKLARENELKGNFGMSKRLFGLARVAEKLENTLIIEEKAVEEGRIIKETDLANMSSGDKLCYKMKILKAFYHYSDQMAGYLYW